MAICGGVYLIEDGAVTSNPVFFRVTIQGKGAHGASPHTGVDAIMMGVKFYNLLETFISRLSDPCEPVVLSVCKMNGGTSRGAIAESFVLEGTVRSFRPEIREQAKTFIEASARAVTQLYGGSYDYYYEAKSFPVMNDPSVSAIRAACGRIDPVIDRSLPVMPQGAGPPDLAAIADGDIPRGHGAVLFVIPLFRQFRISCRKDSALIPSIIPQDDHLPPKQI